MPSFPFYKQLNAMDCGPTCLRMVAKYYGRFYNADGIRQVAGYSKEGVSLLGISEAAEKIGFRTRAVQITFDQLLNEAPLPCILHWDQKHFVILLPGSGWRGKRGRIKVADPGKSVITYTKSEFLQHWLSNVETKGESVGIALLLEPGPKFYEENGQQEGQLNWRVVLQYLRQSRRQLLQVIIALLIASGIQLIFPFLSQSIVDKGITTQNMSYITVVLVAQLVLVFSRSVVDFIRSRLLLQVSVILNLSILSDFWIKLTRLPISYFDTHHTGDTLQRINDNRQIQTFLTGSALNTVFSLLNFVIYAVVLAFYSAELFLVFAVGAIFYFGWVQIFLRVRRKINYQVFHISAKENSATLQLVQGMQEIRLNNAEKQKRWEWENIQAGIFKLNFKSLLYSQAQQAGAILINQGKDVLITFLVAGLVIEGKLTLGAMVAIQYIIGQLSSPIEQFVSFMQSGQDAKIAMERLNEVHQLPDEEVAGTTYIQRLPEDKTIRFTRFSFSYPGPGNEPVLDNIDLEIPERKVTAIVGVSGSGKTTLVKLLLKFYDHYNGGITVGETDFKYISPSFWRRQCGAVLQDGFIFNDTIARNISVEEEVPDVGHLVQCCKTANILTFIESLPNGFNTLLGAEGVGLSQGQKQRLLIARAIYNDPKYLFFDEATNALDANNERVIVENLNGFFADRTVIIVAHRLSTVRNADKIIVLDKGMIAEQGSHEELSRKRGKYYELVKNQLELGN
jgi:ATP-binding cassette subfamily B protein